MIVDLLVNLETPDGALVTPEELMRAAKAAGLDGLVLTRTGHLQPDLSDYQDEAASSGLRIFAGAEVVTNHGLILALLPTGESLSQDFAPKEGGVYEAHSAIDAIEAVGGLTVALRPYDREVDHPMGDYLFSLQGIDACEVMNGRVPEIANDLALEAASNLEMPCVGTSSARGVDGLGSAATLLRVPVQDESELITLLKKGGCWPVSFSDELPKDARMERSGRDRRRKEGAGSSSGGRKGGRGSSPRSSGGRRDRPEGRDGGRRGRSGKGRGRGDGPTRVTSAPEHADRLPDDVGNRVRTLEEGEPAPPDDIGNRLGPGEKSPFHEATRREDEED